MSDTESLIQNEALNDPFTRKITIQENFLNLPSLRNVIIDTHYIERTRLGRHIVFMARILNDFKPGILHGIGIDRDQAICFESTGESCVFGANGKPAYFLAVHNVSALPEVFEKETPITWSNNKKAIESIEISSSIYGSQCFDINQWQALNESIFNYYYVIEGKLMNNKNYEILKLFRST